MYNFNSSFLDDLISSNCFIIMVLVCYILEIGLLVYVNVGYIYFLVWFKNLLVNIGNKGFE